MQVFHFLLGSVEVKRQEGLFAIRIQRILHWVSIGNIVTSFETALKIAYGRHFNQNEISEINRVINGRMPLIRSALFESG